jgi:hypothetical protein
VTGNVKQGVVDVDRDMRAGDLRAAGLTWSQVAQEMGYGDPTGAYRAAHRAWARMPVEEVSESRGIELSKLDRRERVLLRVMTSKHYVVDRGRVVTWKGDPLIDDAPIIAASNALGQIQTARARLLGLNAPTKRYVEVITEDAVQNEIRRLNGIMEELDAIGIPDDPESKAAS